MTPRRLTYQMGFRVSEEDRPLLEAAKAEFGSYQAGILAGLRALARQRLEQDELVAVLLEDVPAPVKPAAPLAPAPAAVPAPPAAPASASDDEPEWWVDPATAAGFIGVSEDTVRRWTQDGGATVRSGPRGQELDLESLQVPRHVVARLFSVKSPTLRRRALEGKPPRPLPNGDYRLGDLRLTIADTARLHRVSQSRVRKLIDSGELSVYQSEHGENLVSLIDASANLPAGAAPPTIP